MGEDRVIENPIAHALELSRQEDVAILLYDGLCNICNASVRFAAPRVAQGKKIFFASLQSETAKELLKEYKIEAFENGQDQDPTTSVVICGGQVFTKLDATIVLLKYFDSMGWHVASLFMSFIPQVIRNGIYDSFAAQRFRLFGGSESVQEIPPALETHFLDHHEGIHVCPRIKPRL